MNTGNVNATSNFGAAVRKPRRQTPEQLQAQLTAIHDRVTQNPGRVYPSVAQQQQQTVSGPQQQG